MESVNAQDGSSSREARDGYKKLLGARAEKLYFCRIDALVSIPHRNIVTSVWRVETRIEHYPSFVTNTPKFIFLRRTDLLYNSGNASGARALCNRGDQWYSVNGHAFAPDARHDNGLVNFAILKTVRFTAPLASGQAFAENLGLQAALMGGGQPLMQRVGDFRLGSRSKEASFSGDLYDFEPTLRTCCPGDISLAIPAKILRAIWKAMKNLDTIVPGVLHPSTIMYYPEIKLYANKPAYLDENFRVTEDIWFAGDGAGTSRGITGAWASGIRSAEGMLATYRFDETGCSAM